MLSLLHRKGLTELVVDSNLFHSLIRACTVTEIEPLLTYSRIGQPVLTYNRIGQPVLTYSRIGQPVLTVHTVYLHSACTARRVEHAHCGWRELW